ncbi:hypothetical protein [Streptomyces nogalater]|uniref:Uncharacterized protein n=1 Tax=Streptomyces nogalater TaxID=38314 RepID=A0ABW0W8D6_STRNO
MRNQPTRAEECPAGVHSIFDPCPGDCGKLLEPTEEERAAGLRYHATITTPPPDPGPEIAANIRRLLADTTRHGRRPRGLADDQARHERRNRYAGIIRDRIKELTWPPTTPGGPPRFGANEYDLADAVLDERDDELEQLRTELARHRRAIALVTRFNQLAVDNGRPTPGAAEHARDTLDILRTGLNGPQPPSTTPDGTR